MLLKVFPVSPMSAFRNGSLANKYYAVWTEKGEKLVKV